LRNVKYLKAHLRDLRSFGEIKATILRFIGDYNNWSESQSQHSESELSHLSA